MLSRREAYHWGIASLPFVVMLLILAGFRSDQAVYQTFHTVKQTAPDLTSVLRFVTDWGNPILYFCYASLLAWSVQKDNPKLRRLVLYYIVAQVLISFLLVHTFKIGFGRPRPGFGDVAQPFSFSSDFNSFPSGHTAEIFGAVLPLVFWRCHLLTSIILGSWASLIAFTRCYLGKHYPSDLLAGWICGCLAALLCLYLWKNNHHELAGGPNPTSSYRSPAHP